MRRLTCFLLSKLWLSPPSLRPRRLLAKRGRIFTSQCKERPRKCVFYFIPSRFQVPLTHCGTSEHLQRTWCPEILMHVSNLFIWDWFTKCNCGTLGLLKVEGTVGVNVAINLPDISFHSHSFIFIHFYGGLIQWSKRKFQKESKQVFSSRENFAAPLWLLSCTHFWSKI